MSTYTVIQWKQTDRRTNSTTNRLRGVENTEPIVTIEVSGVNNEKKGDIRQGS
jgi:hypothetical protein